MGWKDRDYARWNEDERERFLGSSRGTGSGPCRTIGASARSEPGFWTQRVEHPIVAVVVSLALVAVLGVLTQNGFGRQLTLLLHTLQPSQAPPSRSVPVRRPPGTELVCTEIDYATGRCTRFAVRPAPSVPSV